MLNQVTLYNFITLLLILTYYLRIAQQRVKHLRHHSENPGVVQSATRQCKSSLFPCKAPELGPTTCEGISARAWCLCTGFAVFLGDTEKG